MQATYRFSARMCLGLALLGLTACPEPGLRPSTKPAVLEQRADQLVANGENAEAARIYEDLVRLGAVEDRNWYLIAAANQWYLAGDTDNAIRNVFAVQGNLKQTELVTWAPLAARLDLGRNMPETALQHLRTLYWDIPPDLKISVLDLQATALFRIGDPVTGIRILSERELYLTDPTEVLGNQRRIFSGLRESAAANFDLSSPVGLDPLTEGWLALGRAAADARRNPFRLESRFLEWQLDYPGHPANDGLVGEVLANYAALMLYPQRIALVLPLSGRTNASNAAAVRDGFLAAYFQHGDTATRPLVRFYDTSEGALSAYESAILDGAQFVVGPLTKTAVSDVALATQESVVTLALNYLPEQQPVPESFYQFALAPEDEARQVAERAYADGHTHGLLLVPNNAWGRRVHTSFESKFMELGGTLLEYRYYDASNSARDFSAPIKTILHYDESEARRSRLASILGTSLEFTPRIRNDAEFIFVAGQPSQGRAIRPQLRYFYAVDLPVYSTSAIYEPNREANRDLLNGLIFNDVPWLIAPDETSREIRQTIARYWPGRARRRGRLYAMGFDAYRLVPLLFNQPGVLANPVPGMTGALSMDTDGRVHRRLEWAQIRFGEPQLLPGQLSTSPGEPPAAVVGAPGDSPDLLPPENADQDTDSGGPPGGRH